MRSIDGDVLIIGGGPGATSTALELAEHGSVTIVVNTEVHEDRPESTLIQGDLWRGWSGYDVGEASAIVDEIDLAVVSDESLATRRGTLRHAGFVTTRSSAWYAGLRRIRRDSGIAEIEGVVSSIRGAPSAWEVDVEQEGTGARTYRARHLVMADGGAQQLIGRSKSWRCLQVAQFNRAVHRPTMIFPAARIDGGIGPLRCLSLIPDPVDARTVSMILFGVGHVPLAHLNRYAEGLASEGCGGAATVRVVENIRIGPLGRYPDGPEVGFGILEVGDVAGLFNPLSGDGVQHAVDSGRLAGAAILRHFGDPQLAGERYRARLRRSHLGLESPINTSDRRRLLTRRVLLDSIDDDRPFFAKARRGLLLAPGIGGLGSCVRPARGNGTTDRLRLFTLGCDEVVTAAVRRDWPLLSAVMRLESDPVELRPSSLFGLCYLAAGGRNLQRWCALGAAIELASLGSLALLASTGGERSEVRGIDYHVAAATLAGDFLLARSSRIAAPYGNAVAGALSSWLERLIALRVERAPADLYFASVFELPARLGAAVSGATNHCTDALGSYGYNFGAAFSHAEDVLALLGRRTRLDTTASGLEAARLTNIERWDEMMRRESIDRDGLFRELLSNSRSARGSFIDAAIGGLVESVDIDVRSVLIESANSLLVDDATSEPSGVSSGSSGRGGDEKRA